MYDIFRVYSFVGFTSDIRYEFFGYICFGYANNLYKIFKSISGIKKPEGKTSGFLLLYHGLNNSMAYPIICFQRSPKTNTRRLSARL